MQSDSFFNIGKILKSIVYHLRLQLDLGLLYLKLLLLLTVAGFLMFQVLPTGQSSTGDANTPSGLGMMLGDSPASKGNKMSTDILPSL